MHQNFERLFCEADEEGQDETGIGTTNIEVYGILNFVPPVIDLTRLNLNEIMDMSIIGFLNLVCFSIDYNKHKEEEIKKWQKNH